MRIFKFIAFVLCLWAVDRFCHHQTDGFHLSHVLSDLHPDARWEVSPPSRAEQEKISALLNQRFFYLAKGAQCYVFGSEDGTCVLKLFKYHHLRATSLLDSLPLPTYVQSWRDRKKEKKQRLIDQDFTSYKIAYDKLKEETGLIYLHLNKTAHLNQTVTLVDKLNIEHHLELDALEFILQEKAELVTPTINRLVQEGKQAEAQQAIARLYALVELRASKGIEDTDPNLNKNFGFIGDRAIQIDVGRFSLSEHPSTSFR